MEPESNGFSVLLAMAAAFVIGRRHLRHWLQKEDADDQQRQTLRQRLQQWRQRHADRPSSKQSPPAE